MSLVSFPNPDFPFIVGRALQSYSHVSHGISSRRVCRRIVCEDIQSCGGGQRQALRLQVYVFDSQSSDTKYQKSCWFCRFLTCNGSAKKSFLSFYIPATCTFLFYLYDFWPTVSITN